jgi:class 3 adenylate cyclase
LTEVLIAVGVLAVLGVAYLALREPVKRWYTRRVIRKKTAAGIDQAVQLGTDLAVKGVGLVAEQGMGALRAPIEALAGWANTEHPELKRVSRDGTVAILFSDIENSTALNQELGDRRWLKVLGAHDRLVRREVEANEGYVVKSQGDGFMVAFADPVGALHCALAVQRRLRTAGGQLKKTPLRVRIGIHSGRAVAKKGDLYGRNVAMAARVAQEAEGGEILVSGQVAAEAKGVDGIVFGAAREAELKGLGSEELVEVSLADSA